MKVLAISLPDGSMVGIPVEVIARDRAAHYASEFDGDIERSLTEDTMPSFESDPYEVKDWAANNMNWSDVARHAIKIKGPDEPDMQEVWINGPKEVMDIQVAGQA